VYRVYRRLESSQQQMLAGEVSGDGGRDLSLTDSSIDWGKTYEYHVETVTVIAQADRPELRVDGEDSPEVKIIADDVFPPGVPSGLQAVFSGPGQQAFIDLIWAPVPDVDLDGYNVYRRDEGAAPVKVNKELLKTPAYRDGSVVSGKNYLYAVTAVDVRGNESAHSEEAGEAVP
jgi:fibronectin type 3 domain-containing protein